MKPKLICLNKLANLLLLVEPHYPALVNPNFLSVLLNLLKGNELFCELLPTKANFYCAFWIIPTFSLQLKVTASMMSSSGSRQGVVLGL